MVFSATPAKAAERGDSLGAASHAIGVGSVSASPGKSLAADRDEN